MRFLVLLLALVLGGSTAIAERRNIDLTAPADRREAIKKKIRSLRAYTLTEELKLDEPTAAKLFPVLAKWDDVTDKLLVARTDLTRQLEGAGAIKDARAVDKLIDAAIANQKAFWDLEDKRLAELRKILTPAQTARLVVVLPQFERRIQNQLRKAILNQRTGGHGGRGGRAGGRGLDDDEDDDGAGGDLVDDPFGSRGGSRRAPDPAPTRAPAPAPTRGSQKACDPFSTVHGCSSK